MGITVPWSVDTCLHSSSLDHILNPVEWKFRAEELEQYPLKVSWYIWLEIQEIQIGLVVYYLPRFDGKDCELV